MQVSAPTMPNYGTIVSATVTLTVFAGFASGFLYLIVAGIRWARYIRESIAGRIEAERTRTRESIGERGEVGQDGWCWKCGGICYPGIGNMAVNRCSRCRRTVCPSCSVRCRQSDTLCASCLTIRDQELRSGVWFFKELRDRFKTTVAAIRIVDEERNEDIRDVIERVTEKLVGGSLDHVRVGRLTTHPAYMGFMERYQGVLSLTLSRLSTAVQFAVEDLPPSKEETPKHVHFQLKGLVKEIIHEANSLPLFKGYTRKLKSRVEDLSTKTYEDILATAILNKIIEKFQIYPKRPVKHITDYDKTVYSESENSDSDSECSIETGDGFSVSTDPLSMTFDGHMHENQRCDDEIIDEVSNFGFYHKYKLEFPKLGKQHAEGNKYLENDHSAKKKERCQWEENWLLKKKKLRSMSSSSVTMLVPSPIDNVKAQIGDTDADETSNFSDCSDTELVQLLNPGTFNGGLDEMKELSEPHYEEIGGYGFNYEHNGGNIKDLLLGTNTIQENGPQHVDYAPTHSGEGSLEIEQDSEYTEIYESTKLIAATNSRNEIDNYPNEKDQHMSRSWIAERNKALLTTEGGTVKQLAKHFSGTHNHHKVHSLTARNLSRGLQVQGEILRNYDSKIKDESFTKTIEMDIPPKVLTNIAFWEQIAVKSK